jgi:hypothetical protein
MTKLTADDKAEIHRLVDTMRIRPSARSPALERGYGN